MSTNVKSHIFGHKGASDGAVSLAESLLSGKPVGRAQGHDRIPKLKPRARPLFGRKDVSEAFARTTRRLVQRRSKRAWAALVLGLVLAAQAVTGVFNWPSPTLGGRQLWTDVRVQGGWRVQCHAWTGHCRLLDNHDIRRTWGGETATLAAMDLAIEDGRITAPDSHAVVLVHGLGRSAHSFDAMAAALNANGYEVVAFNYASTQGTIAEHAHALNRVVAHLRGVKQVSFVTHSLGGVVLRQALTQKPKWQGAIQQGRTVMLAAPNQGSQVAQTLAPYAPARWLFGPALKELADAKAIKQLSPPSSFATVAGLNNPLWVFSEDSDGLVSVDEARLSGEAEHLDVAAAHTFIMDDPDVIAFTTGFMGKP